MARVLYFVGWILLAVVMITADLTFKTWQFWAIEGCVALITITNAVAVWNR